MKARKPLLAAAQFHKQTAQTRYGQSDSALGGNSPTAVETSTFSLGYTDRRAFRRAFFSRRGEHGDAGTGAPSSFPAAFCRITDEPERTGLQHEPASQPGFGESSGGCGELRISEPQHKKTERIPSDSI